MLIHYIKYSDLYSIDYISIHEATGLLIYKQCKYSLIPSRINSHFTGPPHRSSPNIRFQIRSSLSGRAGLVKNKQGIDPSINHFIQNSSNAISPFIISDLALYQDRLACSYYSYISRSIDPIKKHLKNIYN